MRLHAPSETLRESFPEAAVDLAVAVSALGEPTVLMALLALCYWLTRRRASALVVSYAFAGYAFVLALETLFGLPGPPEAVARAGTVPDEHAFPSGHAVAATVVYGGLHRAFEPTRERLALAAVGLVIGTVSLSRVVLGAHYLGDVLAGVALGVGFLLAVERVAAGDPRRGFLAGVVFAVPALVLTDVGADALLALGGSVGGTVGSWRLEALPALRSRLEGAVLAGVGSGFVLATMAAAAVLEAAGGAPALASLYAVLVGGILVMPAGVAILPFDRVGSTGTSA